jgi:alanine dehydrogenase
MIGLLAQTDMLIDATQRPNPSQVVIPNRWVGVMPEHAVLVDLSVDPYDCDSTHLSLKGIEGIPQGNLDQYIFTPDDPAFDVLPDCADTTHRRTSVSCYSWPGVHPRDCMQTYGPQIFPLMRAMVECGGVECIDPRGGYFERAVSRAMLSRWKGEKSGLPA